MVNPSMMRELARERERDLLGLAGPPRLTRSRLPALRMRLGWSLVDLGTRLALEVRPAHH